MTLNSSSLRSFAKKALQRSASAAMLCTLALVSQGAFAGVLTLAPSGNSIDNVSISKSASATIAGRHFDLATVGAGLRAKKVAFVNIKVYVAQLLVSDSSKFVRTSDGALDSMNSMSQAAIRLDFLRSVDAQTVQSSFRDSFLANQVDMNRPEIQQFLTAVAAGGDALEGKSLTLVGEKLADGTEAITYEDSAGKVTTVSGPAGFMREVFSIWLGKATDAGVENLKKALIGSN